MNILFMGSGDFALPILQKLYHYHKICAIYTAPFAQGNTRKAAINEVETFAIQHKIKLHKEHKITSEVISDIAGYNPDVIVVASYGFLLPDELLQVGAVHKPINVHPSLLPRWRGAAPIERTLEAGEKKTAVCVMKMVKKMDAGDILIAQDVDINETIDAIDLRQITAKIGGDLVIKWLENPTAGVSQDVEGYTHAKKISKEELMLNFNDNFLINHNKIRAFVGNGGCWFNYNNEKVKIISATYKKIQHTYQNGFIDTKNQVIYCEGGALLPILMQREGRKIMSAKDVFNGLR